jgi:hypothetical protein
VTAPRPLQSRLWRDQGKLDAARDLLAPVYNWFTGRFRHARPEEEKTLLDDLTA